MIISSKKLLPIFIVLLNCLAANCANWQAPELDSLSERQAYVIDWSPQEGSQLHGQSLLYLHFSRALDPDSIGAQSIALLKGPLNPDLAQDTQDLSQALAEGQLANIALDYHWDATSHRLSLTSQEPLDPESPYQLIVTPNLISDQGLPFNQEPGQAPKALIINFGPEYLENNMNPSDPTAEVPSPSFGPAPDFLVINEFLYDGLISESDGEAFIEIHGNPGADISLYQIKLINGANGQATDQITLPLGSLIGESEVFVIADTKTGSSSTSQVAVYDLLDNFDPQNGPDAIQLFDREGQVLDSVTYGEGAVPLSTEGHPLAETQPAPDTSGGKSLSRLDGQDSDNNFLDFFEQEIPSPGIL